nr:hypothetical protein [Actinomycetota bacterium]
QMRREEDTPLVRQPGPAKVAPPDFSRLEKDIAQMSHGQNRTQVKDKIGTATVFLLGIESKWISD